MQNIVKRDEYLKQLIAKKGNGLIKVITELDVAAKAFFCSISFIQSALNASEPAKLESELRPLRNTKDFFKKIIISKTSMKAWTDEEGILHLGLYEFLLN